MNVDDFEFKLIDNETRVEITLDNKTVVVSENWIEVFTKGKDHAGNEYWYPVEHFSINSRLLWNFLKTLLAKTESGESLVEYEQIKLCEVSIGQCVQFPVSGKKMIVSEMLQLDNYQRWVLIGTNPLTDEKYEYSGHRDEYINLLSR